MQNAQSKSNFHGHFHFTIPKQLTTNNEKGSLKTTCIERNT